MTIIYWPAILHYDNDPELDYLENEAAWNHTVASAANAFEQNDLLIDSEGQAFSCTQLSRASTGITAPIEKMELETVLGLIKAHLADTGSCCVAKAYAPTIRDAIGIVENKECDID